MTTVNARFGTKTIDIKIAVGAVSQPKRCWIYQPKLQWWVRKILSLDPPRGTHDHATDLFITGLN